MVKEPFLFALCIGGAILDFATLATDKGWRAGVIIGFIIAMVLATTISKPEKKS